jgi:O-antigen ligase
VIYLLIGYMWMFIHRPFEIWDFLATIRSERVYIIVAGIAWLFYPEKGWIRNILNPAFALFFVATLMSWYVSPYPDEGQYVIEDYLKYTVFYILVLSTIRDERQFRLLMLGFVVAVGLYMGHSYREFLSGKHEYRQGIVRMIGVDETYQDPNTFAGTLMFAFPFSFPFWSEAAKLARRSRRCLAYLLLLGYTLLTIVCVNLTGSRRGFMGLVFLAAAVGILRIKRRLLSLIVMPLVCLIVWNLLPEQLQDRYTTLIDSSKGPEVARESAEGRFKAFSDSLELWERSPAFGFGPMAFGKAVGHGFRAHNLYAQLFGEVGTFGILGFGAVLMGYGFNAYRAWSLSRSDQALKASFSNRMSQSVTLSVLLLLFMGVGGHSLFRYNWLWFGAFQAAALHCLRHRATAGQ